MNQKKNTDRPKNLLKAIEEINERCLMRRVESQIPCTSDADSLMSCQLPEAIPDPEVTLMFRRPLPIETVIFRKQPDPDPTLGIGCLGFFSSVVNATLGLDLIHEQRWCFKKHIVSALATTISLAPNETLRLSIRNTQRKQFDKTNIKEVDQTESIESTIVDRDVLNITRSSSTTNNWSVSGNGSLSLPIKSVEIGLGISGSLSKSVTDSSQSSSEQVNEATRKSSHNLRTLQKTEIKETVETTEDKQRSRVITNPYRDRSMRLNIYSLGKEYNVQFALTHLRPVVIFEFNKFNFSRGFVIANGAFLDKYLQDKNLKFELTSALEIVNDVIWLH